jgi:hypothetical protein
LAEEERAQELAAAPSAPAWSGYEGGSPVRPIVGAPAAKCCLPQKRCRLRPSSFPPQRRRWWSCTRTPAVPDREDAKAERGVRSGSGEGKGGEGGGGGAGVGGRRRRRMSGGQLEARHQRWRRDPRGLGAREDRQETQPHENGAQSPARAGKGVRKTRRSGDKTRANAAPRRARHTRHTRLFIAHRTPHTAHYHTTHHIPI